MIKLLNHATLYSLEILLIHGLQLCPQNTVKTDGMEWNGQKERVAERVRRKTKKKWKIGKIDMRLKQSNLHNYLWKITDKNAWTQTKQCKRKEETRTQKLKTFGGVSLTENLNNVINYTPVKHSFIFGTQIKIFFRWNSRAFWPCIDSNPMRILVAS